MKCVVIKWSVFAGYLINGLRFCAQSAPPGLIYGSNCPGFSNTSTCPWNAEYSFWASASKHFANEASGEATVMINASLSPAYPNSSFLAKWEVPHINPSKLSKLNIWMVTIPGQNTKETCLSDSILTLKSELTQRNIAWNCTDEPTEVLLFLCLDHESEEICKRLYRSSASSNQMSFSFILISLLTLLT
ncbi:ADP-ribosyl cyclase/cyclic ADP-ribose hydrolase-like [Gigantopelta aegis]|uniref:ADP-ribosyl cyclase/cyclic ADP-ribose hydrolase-like n=1 Tax=Gigantopelta aegis TaxID=1735272 RepID=UPI001B88873E|nr:ADP-ribosyl cyclase/cyclic ADP-ribose hydrolase-like [Gigantopelta aegis]